jgi:hypothetical protein
MPEAENPDELKDDLEIRTPGRVGGAILRGETAPPSGTSASAALNTAAMKVRTQNMKSATAFVILILSGFSAPRCGATVYESNGSLANVQALHNAAKNGDTITLPAGTFSWTSQLNITKGITLQGQTTISGAGTATPSVNDLTIIKDDTPRTGAILKATTSSSQSFRLTGITFSPGASTASGARAVLLTGGDSAATHARVDNCHFDALHQGRIIWTQGWVQGVADHNLLIALGHTQPFFISEGSYGGTSQINGNGSWADYPWYGTEKFFFIEDNTIIRINSPIASSMIDTNPGGRWVARHNYIQNCLPSGHGTEGGPGGGNPQRGQRASEFYDNIVNMTVAWNAGGQRSGTSMWHDNTYTGHSSGTGYHCNLVNFRESAPRGISLPWGMADGTSPWDANDTEGNGTYVEGHAPHLFDSGTDNSSVHSNGVIHDSTKNWTTNQWVGYSIRNTNRNSPSYRLGSYVISNTSNTITYANPTPNAHSTALIFNSGDAYQIQRVLITMDQNGRGKSDQITGAHNPINTRTGTPYWPRSALEPCFSWNNVHTPANTAYGFGLGSAVGQPTTKINVDYFNLGKGLPSDTTPAQVSSTYTAALNGVAYTGTYVYPHPLVSGVGSPTPTPSGTPSFPRHLHKENKTKAKKAKKKREKGPKETRRMKRGTPSS